MNNLSEYQENISTLGLRSSSFSFLASGLDGADEAGLAAALAAF